jgi:DNA invertase Pin-like site-specific DNA recombinase
MCVDLTWTWSKRQDLADLLRSGIRRLAGQDPTPVEDRQANARTTVKIDQPRRVVDRLGEDAVRELIEARRAGMKLKDVARQYGISESSVKRVTRGFGETV